MFTDLENNINIIYSALFTALTWFIQCIFVLAVFEVISDIPVLTSPFFICRDMMFKISSFLPAIVLPLRNLCKSGYTAVPTTLPLPGCTLLSSTGANSPAEDEPTNEEVCVPGAALMVIKDGMDSCGVSPCLIPTTILAESSSELNEAVVELMARVKTLSKDLAAKYGIKPYVRLYVTNDQVRHFSSRPSAVEMPPRSALFEKAFSFEDNACSLPGDILAFEAGDDDDDSCSRSCDALVSCYWCILSNDHAVGIGIDNLKLENYLVVYSR
ncbi:hypothetical protein MFLAVUS_008380 [Mucor flavus]|uniref:Uncharacterized protein n=1 Tax=Mucor flavus TaxID=439312 RepID=A0ABP9Z706_9FUNG